MRKKEKIRKNDLIDILIDALNDYEVKQFLVLNSNTSAAKQIYFDLTFNIPIHNVIRAKNGSWN